MAIIRDYFIVWLIIKWKQSPIWTLYIGLWKVILIIFYLILSLHQNAPFSGQGEEQSGSDICRHEFIWLKYGILGSSRRYPPRHLPKFYSYWLKCDDIFQRNAEREYDKILWKKEIYYLIQLSKWFLIQCNCLSVALCELYVVPYILIHHFTFLF